MPEIMRAFSVSKSPYYIYCVGATLNQLKKDGG
jgi:hypothetical protein